MQTGSPVEGNTVEDYLKVKTAFEDAHFSQSSDIFHNLKEFYQKKKLTIVSNLSKLDKFKKHDKIN